MRTKTYDKQCLALAYSFLSDSNADISNWRELSHQLAQEIQQTIEDFMEDNNLQ